MIRLVAGYSGPRMVALRIVRLLSGLSGQTINLAEFEIYEVSSNST